MDRLNMKQLIILYLILTPLVSFSQDPQDTSTYSDCKTYTDTIKICENSSVNFQEFSYSNTLTPIMWKWWFQGANPDTSNQRNPIDITYNTPGRFNVKCSTVFEFGTFMWYRTSIIKCMVVEVIEFKNYNNISIQDTSICKGDVITLNAINNDTFPDTTDINYLWTSRSSSIDEIFITTKTIKINKPGFYKVRIFNFCGNGEKEIEVSDDKCSHYLPNAFTPNRDGVNDIYNVYVGSYNDYLIIIYNRWGEKLFESTNPSNGWDGYYNNELCENGVYAVFVLVDKKIYSTNIHLLR